MNKFSKLNKKINEPDRDPDYTSKRGVPYWWAPEWVRKLNGSICRIVPIKKVDNEVELYMVSKAGNLSCIPGAIQREFKKWHEDRQIDYILLDIDEDELIMPEWLELDRDNDDAE